MGQQFKNRNSQVATMVNVDSITLGVVIATNDPHQMGRLKICCPALGDDPADDIGDKLPWANFMSPLGGMVNSTFTRGANDGEQSDGPIAYGLWGVPKRGATVVVACIDGDPYYRVWMGSVFDQGSANTLPHGRYFYQKTEGVEGDGAPEGPLDSYESPIEPLYTNLGKAFKTRKGNFEWRTRGADYSAMGNPKEFSKQSPSEVIDEVDQKNFTSEDGKEFAIKNGFADNRMDGQDDGQESSVYSWTTPGFHSISMDDRPEACRIKIRTTGGTQLIMDDTNERIYISTAEGNNWIEMDWNGNIDIHGKDLSFHAVKNINFTADDTIRMYAKNGLHMYSEQEINMEAKADINVKGHADLRVRNDGEAYHHSGGDMNHKADGEIRQTGVKMYLNGKPAKAANPKPTKWTMRVPSHEPFARVMTKNDFTHEPEFEYKAKEVGTVERGVIIPRGKFWRR